ncbi:hypothetical protein BGX28_003997 [Mortierella sp. GBA30]|nr:hypothetical protein BGX28_003997 [Mortierella sp. GBA30]
MVPSNSEFDTEPALPLETPVEAVDSSKTATSRVGEPPLARPLQGTTHSLTADPQLLSDDKTDMAQGTSSHPTIPVVCNMPSEISNATQGTMPAERGAIPTYETPSLEKTARGSESDPVAGGEHEMNGHSYDQDLKDENGFQLEKDERALHDMGQLSDEKYRRLKRKLKEVLEENERLSTELNRSNRRARNLRREKNLLLDQLCAKEYGSDSSAETLSSFGNDSDLSDSSLISQGRSRMTTPLRPVVSSTKHLRVPSKEVETSPSQGVHHPKKSINKPTVRKEPKELPTPSTITNVGSATQKPKRIHNSAKQRPSLSKVRKIQPVERDENGNIKFPVTVGIITLVDIGHVVYDREAFHNERYIWPVGYKMSRSYNSMIDPNNLTTYTCSVIDDGEAPKFQIDAEDQPGKPIIAGTATGAWTHVVKTANQIRKREHSNSASGPDYFGFSNATIAKMIQDLPDVDKCTSYIMQRFEEPSIKALSSPEKRKASALESSSADKADVDEEQLDEVEEEEDEEEEYTTLGTPAKKVKYSVSPKVRNAAYDLDPTSAPQNGGREEDVEIGQEEEEKELNELYEDQVIRYNAETKVPTGMNPVESKGVNGNTVAIKTSAAAPAGIPVVITAAEKSTGQKDRTEPLGVHAHDTDAGADIGMKEAIVTRDGLSQN